MKKDFSEKDLIKGRKRIMKLLQDYQPRRTEIELTTRCQSRYNEWTKIRKIMLTSPDFAAACKWNPKMSCARRVKEILYPFKNNKASMYDLQQESLAKKKLAQNLAENIQDGGIFIDTQHSRLADWI